jgi:predicted nucleic acid-binding protein
MIVLDTDIVTLLSYGRNEKLQGRIELVDDEEILAITFITRMEILRGRHDSILKAASTAEMQTATQRFQAAEAMLNDFALLYPTVDSCRHFEALAQPRRGKKKMRRPDMLIASIALAQNAVLVTRNVKDYKDVPNLRVENWAD